MQNFRSIISQPALANEIIKEQAKCLFKFVCMYDTTYTCGILKAISDTELTVYVDEIIDSMDDNELHKDNIIPLAGISDIQIIILKELL